MLSRSVAGNADTSDEVVADVATAAAAALREVAAVRDAEAAPRSREASAAAPRNTDAATESREASDTEAASRSREASAVARNTSTTADAAAAAAADVEVAYLAQHRLLEQLPELAADVEEPALWPEPCEVRNVWLGTRGTVTPLHFDSLDNFFCQVAGAPLSQGDASTVNVQAASMYGSTRLYLDRHDRAPGCNSSRSRGNVSAVDVQAASMCGSTRGHRRRACTQTAAIALPAATARGRKAT